MADHWARHAHASPSTARKQLSTAIASPNPNPPTHTMTMNGSSAAAATPSQQHHHQQQHHATNASAGGRLHRQPSASVSPSAAQPPAARRGGGGSAARPAGLSFSPEHRSGSGTFSLPMAHSEPTSPVRRVPSPFGYTSAAASAEAAVAASATAILQAGGAVGLPRTGRSRSLRASGGKKREGGLARQRSLRGQSGSPAGDVGAAGAVGAGTMRLGSATFGVGRGHRRQRPPSGKLSPLPYHRGEAEQGASGAAGASPVPVLSPIAPPPGAPRGSRPPSQLSSRASNASNSPAPMMLVNGAAAEDAPPSPTITFTSPQGQRESPASGGVVSPGGVTSPLQRASTPGGERPQSRSPVPWQPRPPSRATPPKATSPGSGSGSGGVGGGGSSGGSSSGLLRAGHPTAGMGRSITPDTLESMRSMAVSPTLAEMSVEGGDPNGKLSSSAGASFLSDARGTVRPLPRRRSLSGASRPPSIAEGPASATGPSLVGSDTITLRNGTVGGSEMASKTGTCGVGQGTMAFVRLPTPITLCSQTGH